MGASTFSRWHTLTSAHNIAFVARAGLNTGVFAFGWSLKVRASRGTGTAAELIVAIGWTLESFMEKKENTVKRLLFLFIIYQNILFNNSFRFNDNFPNYF